MKKTMYLFILLSMMFFIFTIGTYAEERMSTGYKPKHVDIYRVQDTENKIKKFNAGVTDSKYCAADQSWFPQYVRERNQNPHGTCWAFAATNAADISYAKEINSPNVVRTSPGHFAYFHYNRITDPLGLTTGDKNLAGDDSWCEAGGSSMDSFQSLANRIGLASEAIAPYTKLTNDRFSCKGGYSYNEDLAYNLTYQLENATVISPECADNKEAYNKLIKQEIIEHGSVTSSVYWGGESSNTKTLYNYKDATADHAITIVGWDDDFSRTEFRKSWIILPYYYSIPKENGAWICLNSWGESFGDKGLFYVSYEDVTINEEGVVSYDMEPYKVNEDLYQYDGTSLPQPIVFSDNETKVANVFRAQKRTDNIGRELSKFGFTEWNEGKTFYTVRIYDGLSNAEDPESGKEVASKKVSTTHPGYYSFKLDTPVKLTEGGLYSVVIEFDDTTSFGTEVDYPKYEDYYSVNVGAGQSFSYDNFNDKWVDLKSNSFYGYPTNLRIKAYLDQGKKKQTISVATSQEYEMGEDGKKINAKLVNGSGELSYVVKSGKDVLDVDNKTGLLTFKKAGTSVVTVKALENKDYYEAIQDVNITVKKTITKETPKIKIIAQRPSKVLILKVKAKKKSLVVNYGAATNAYKYKISVATNKHATSVKKTTAKLKETIKNLKSKKVYYVKVRSMNQFGLYGSWSDIKKVKVK